MSKYEIIGIAKQMMHDDAGARAPLLRAKEYAEKYVSAAPEEGKRHSRLGEILACLGEKGAAIAEARRGTELVPENIDAFDGPQATQTLAEVYAMVGEADKALDLVEHLLSRPSGLTVAMLKIHPVWDRLRQDPRFVPIIKKHGG